MDTKKNQETLADIVADLRNQARIYRDAPTACRSSWAARSRQLKPHHI